MRPLGYKTRSLTYSPRLIKRAAVIGRLYYHTAQCLLAQINPTLAKDSDQARAAQLHHAHQVCGIVAHTQDRGVASVSIRSLAIVAEVLSDLQEQQEVVTILEKIDRETGWKLAGVVKLLKKTWGWEKMGQTSLASQLLAPHNRNPSGGGGLGDLIAKGVAHEPLHQQPRLMTQTTTPPQQMMPPVQTSQAMATQQQTSAVAAPRPVKINPLSFADFSLPNHPYQNWYEPPSRSNAYNSQGFL
jgi:hypothetical protein